MNRKKLAKFGEDIAAQFLENNDYEILKRNYHSVYGEIDIICKKDNQLIFVEVKARQSDKFGGPLDAITENKKDKIIKTTYHYLAKYELESPVRFDIITIQYIAKDKNYKFHHIKNAFFGTSLTNFYSNSRTSK
ncbi:MAG: YraN family protein [Candidatus Cloacimonetes bacterium]|nr:YraN family protein [Candidatus Cloacimonadota bacterium]MBL7107929.1 YraN family protein [Candidatus Cloacimonadota bacterium]